MKTLKNMKIRSKLMVSFTLVVVITLIIGYLSISNLRLFSEKEKTLYNENLKPIAQLAEMTNYFQRIRVNVNDIILSSSSDDIAENENLIRNYDSKIEDLIRKFSYSVSSDSEKNSFNGFNNDYKNYYSNTEQIIGLVANGQKEKAIKVLNNVMNPLAKSAQNQLSTLIRINSNEGNHVYLADASIANTIIWTLVGFLLAGIIISVLLALYISRLVSGGINQIFDRIDSLKNICVLNLKNGAEQMAKGILNVKIETGTQPLNIDSEDEIGLLASSVNNIILMIQETVVSVEKAISKVAGLITETNQLVDASMRGDLNERGDVSQFEGGYREVIEGLNNTLNSISLPFSEANQILEKMAAGNLAVKMTGSYNGEYKTLKDSINKTAQSLCNILADVTSSIEATASAATQISSNAEEIAAGSQEQSAQTAEIATAVEQMTKTIMETSRNAHSASDAAKDAGAIAEDGGNAVFDTVKGMEKIDEIVAHASLKVLKLGESSAQIGEIIQVIDDIADQTNLLALNAAIEAARAGEQGRGFAVVADEVRKLAERTTKATKEIAQMIKQIQNDTKDAVSSIGSGTEEVSKGKSLTEKAGGSLKKIISGSVKVVDIISQVAVASEEQSSAAEQISKNIESITAVTHQSASGVQQIARATEDLNRLTLNLQELISKFEIEKPVKHAQINQNGLLETYN